jgi:hypothetical protein
VTGALHGAPPEWTAGLSRRARSEGWDVFERTDGPAYEIQRLDEVEDGGPAFPSDGEAVQHVRSLYAAYGDRVHALALVIHDRCAAQWAHDRAAAAARDSIIMRALRAERASRAPNEAEMLENSVP